MSDHFTPIGTVLAAAWLIAGCADMQGLSTRSSLNGADRLAAAKSLASAPVSPAAWPHVIFARTHAVRPHRKPVGLASTYLELGFEKHIHELERQLSALESQLNPTPEVKEAARTLKAQIQHELREIYDKLEPSNVVKVARHSARPQTLDYIELIRRSATRMQGTLLVLLEMAALKLPHTAQEVLPFTILFGTMLAAGVVAMLAFQMFINIGMTIGVSPITGIPLPFVSYGGSSIVTTYIATGLLLNVHMRRLSS